MSNRSQGEVDPADLQGFVDKFIAAMDEDINAANGITVVFELAKWINSGHYNQDVKDALTKMLEVFWSGLCRRRLGCRY